MEDLHDEEECRVCRGEAEPGRLLFAPCKCSGSIRYVHSDCLSEWLAISKKDACELCSYKFTFQPVYAEGCPKKLPSRELVMSILIVALKKWIPYAIRGILVVIAWLIVAPWCTSWLYRLWMLRAASMGTVNFYDRMKDNEMLTSDVLSGMVLIVVIVCSFLSLMSFADFLRFNMDNFLNDPEDDAELRHREFLLEQELNEAEARDGRHRLIEGVDGDIWVRDDSDDGEVDEDSDDEQVHDAFGNEVVVEEEMLQQIQPQIPVAGGRENLLAAVGDRMILRRGIRHGRPRNQQNRVRIREGDNLRFFNDAIQQIPHAAVFRPHVARNIRPDPRVIEAERIANGRQRIGGRRNNRPRADNPGANNNEWDDDFDHMEINIAMDEVIGFRGPIHVLLRNVSWFLAFNGAYLGIFAFVPYTLGSTLVATFGRFVHFMDFSVLTGPSDDFPHLREFVAILSNSTEISEARGDCLQLVDVLTCCIGYTAFCGTVVLWRVLVTTISMYTHRPLLSGLLWFLSCLNAVVKVGTFVLLKMFILPVILGFGFDFATLELFLKTPWDRVEFFFDNMIASLMIHWVLGIGFMLSVTVVVLQLREVMHPDILAATIRPQEPNQDVLKTMLSEQSLKQARRMIMSLGIYAILQVILVYIPVRIAFSMAPSLFPLKLELHYIFAHVQAPLELSLAHMIVLNILDNNKHAVGNFQSMWIAALCSKLGLVGYLLPRVPSLPNDKRKFIILSVPPLSFTQVTEVPPENEKLYGARYHPWPEDGNNPCLMEYNLLPREFPAMLPLRLCALAISCWLTTVVFLAGATLGPLILGRLSTSMVQEYFGIRHDSLNAAAGVVIFCVLINGWRVLRILSIKPAEVHPQLRSHGYELRNMTTKALARLAFTWCVVFPLIIGTIGGLLLGTSDWPGVLEMHLFGTVVLQVFLWVVCSLTLKKKRGRNNQQANENPELIEDRIDELHQADQNILNSLRLAYEQISFHIQANDEGIDAQRDLTPYCFDIGHFHENVIHPIGSAMFVCTVLPWICSKLHGLFGWSNLSETHVFRAAFLTQILGFLLIASKSYLSEWFTKLHDSIRDERYLIGRQLQNMRR